MTFQFTKLSPPCRPTTLILYLITLLFIATASAVQNQNDADFIADYLSLVLQQRSSLTPDQFTIDVR